MKKIKKIVKKRFKKKNPLLPDKTKKQTIQEIVKEQQAKIELDVKLFEGKKHEFY